MKNKFREIKLSRNGCPILGKWRKNKIGRYYLSLN